MQSTNPYLSDKFIPAALPEVYAPRRALLTHLSTASQDGFIFITAPAGSGKTVTALLWLKKCRRKPIWIGLDEYDNAPAVFYKLISAGLCSTQPDNENMRKVFENPAFSASPAEHTISLISEMHTDIDSDASGSGRVLVLDDMHLITNPEIIKSLPFVLKRLPQTFVTMILSRGDLPETLAALIKHKHQIIRSEQLHFTQSEITDYYKNLGLFLTPEESAIAQTATNGWAIGVNAIAQSGDFSVRQGDGVFAHFFEEHIWNTWDDRLRDFCLCTCIVDEFDTALAQQLSGREDAGATLAHLSRTNTFISRLRDDTYRYHHLFTDFLREKLIRGSDRYAALCKIAANYYMDEKDYSMALRYWLDSGDYKHADKFLLYFMFHNHHGDIAGYVDFLRMYFIRDFPGKAYRDFPALHVCCAWYYYMTGQYKLYEYHADEGYKHIARIALFDPKFVEFAILMYSVDHRSELMEKIGRFGAFAKLIASFSPDGIIRHIASFTHNLPYVHRSSFDYTDILSKNRNLDILRKSPFMTLLGDQGEAIIQLGIVGACYERNDLETALGHYLQLSQMLTPGNSIEFQVSAKFLYHSILLAMEREDEAAAALADLSGFVQAGAPFFSSNLEAYKVRLALRGCDKGEARAWLSNYVVTEAQHIELYLVFEHFTTARAHIALGDTENALRYLEMLREFGLSLNRVCDYCEACVLLSVLHWAAGSRKEAVSCLEPALIKLQKYGYSRIVIDEGAAIEPVLRRIAADTGKPGYNGGLCREFVTGLVLETHRFAKKHRGITYGFAASSKPVKLSKQQRNMLTLLSKGYSNAMIAEHTGLKLTTIKTHTSIAYQKLGVNNAADAVLKARELGLL